MSDGQVRMLRKKLKEGKTQADAAMIADMSERSARRWKDGPLPSQKKERHWRTRKDPFADVWNEEVVPLLKLDTARKLQATTIFDHLMDRFPDSFEPGQIRTLQRRVRQWRAQHGSDQEVMFPQDHPPGREGAFDFTNCNELDITIAGAAFPHLLFTFTLSFSGWTRVSLAFRETFEAVSAGLQDALWELGGVPEVARHDNLSAATRELKDSGGRGLTRRFADLAEHYGFRSTRINPGKSHENGVAEQSNFRVKNVLEQALILRGSHNFGSVDEYMNWVREIVDRKRNQPRSTKIVLERLYLEPLPARPLPTYTRWECVVRSWSTIQVAGHTYSVPSRLIGEKVIAHQHADHVEVFYRGRLTAEFPRIRSGNAQIDYRHVAHSLARKPGAFARYRFREELFPTLNFRRAYDALRQWRGERAEVEYVRILRLAVDTMEATVDVALSEFLKQDVPFDYAAIQAVVAPAQPQIPKIQLSDPNIARYNELLSAGGGR